MKKVMSFVVLGLIFTGCGGGTSSTSSGFDTGISASRKLSSLNQAETVLSCEKTQAYLDKFFTKDNICNFISTFTNSFSAANGQTFDQQKCEADKQECLKDPTIQVGDFSDCQEVTIPATCDASVELFEKCIEEETSMFVDIFERASCATPELITQDDDIPTDAPIGAITPNCKKLEQQCPDLYLLDDNLND